MRASFKPFRCASSYTSLIIRPEIQNIERLSAVLILLFAQLILIIIFIIFTTYAPEADASDLHNSFHPVFGGFDPNYNSIVKQYTC